MDLPCSLKNEPLIEVIWQLKFESSQEIPIDQILLGILYEKLKIEPYKLSFEKLPISMIPEEIVLMDPNLTYLPSLRIKDKKSSIIWQVGKRMISVHCVKPYIGWIKFKEKIDFLLKIISQAKLNLLFREHSFRYINFFSEEDFQKINFFNLSINLDKPLDLKNISFQTRLELKDEDNDRLTCVLQIIKPAFVEVSGEEREGIVVDVAAIIRLSDNIKIEEIVSQLETLHHGAKKFFFKKIISEEGLSFLEPQF